jgi:hypothetical protein
MARQKSHDQREKEMPDEQEPDWAKSRIDWYMHTFILFELVKQLAHKEGTFIEKLPKGAERQAKVARCINAQTIDFLRENMGAFRFLQFPTYNMYFSLMSYSALPLFSFAPPQRKEQYKEWTNGKYKSYAIGYDWGIDIDADSWQTAQKDALKVKRLFDKYRLPYSVKFSGSKGFHFLIEYRWLPKLPIGKLVPMLAELTYMLKHIDNIPSIDDSIIDERRVFKLAYSFDRGKIALPLDDEQLKSFDPAIVTPEYCLKAIPLKGRGLLTRNTDQTEEQARESFLKFAKLYIDTDKYKEVK